MPYPDSPFSDGFDVDAILSLKQGTVDNDEIKRNMTNLLRWLCNAPKLTYCRVNTIACSRKHVKELIHQILAKTVTNHESIPHVEEHPLLTDVLIIHPRLSESQDLQRHSKEVIIDANCGAAILRGAHIFAPGVLAMQSKTRIGDKVSVYADISHKCKKGLIVKYTCPYKVFVANGIVRMDRSLLFGDNLNVSGIAVEITDTTSGCSGLSESDFPTGVALLQNFPSIVCSYVMNPKPGETVLDMCASPGNKTTHLAALMNNEGILVALDKTVKKVKQLKQRCEEFFVKNVYIYQTDSTKSVKRDSDEQNVKDIIETGPPFPPESFDKILLDAPCSALGNRPQLKNNITEKNLKSYIPVQRKLLECAVQLLKPGGHLVYSTCTITAAENEAMVAWALETFPQIALVAVEPSYGSSGWIGCNLSDEHCQLVRRYESQSDLDTIGFFIAHFVKSK